MRNSSAVEQKSKTSCAVSRAKASKATQAQSRLKELDRMQDIAPAHIDSPFSFRFADLDQLPDFLMQVEQLSIGFAEPLVERINLSIRADTRIGLLGFNGSGKSTLLRCCPSNIRRWRVRSPAPRNKSRLLRPASGRRAESAVNPF